MLAARLTLTGAPESLQGAVAAGPPRRRQRVPRRGRGHRPLPGPDPRRRASTASGRGRRRRRRARRGPPHPRPRPPAAQGRRPAHPAPVRHRPRGRDRGAAPAHAAAGGRRARAPVRPGAADQRRRRRRRGAGRPRLRPRRSCAASPCSPAPPASSATWPRSASGRSACACTWRSSAAADTAPARERPRARGRTPLGRRRRRRGRRAVGGRLRGHLIDVGPLRRHRDFRLLTFGQAVSFLGSMITYVALPFQVYELTGSSLQVGLLGLVELVPILIMAFVGGALADAVDRRRMVRITEGALAVASGVLLANASLDQPRVWVLYVLAAVMAALDGLQRPSLEALLPRLVDKRGAGLAAAALRTLFRTFGMVAGPPFGGVLIAAVRPALHLRRRRRHLRRLAGGPGGHEGRAAAARRRPAEPAQRARRPALRGQPPGAPRHLPGRHRGHALRHAERPLPGDGRRARRPEGARPAVRRARGRLAARSSLFSGWAARVHRHGLAISIAASVWGVGIIAFGMPRTWPWPWSASRWPAAGT